MGNIGPLEIILILVVALLVFGPKRLPEVGRSVGRGLREFRRASTEFRDELERSVEDVPPAGTGPAPSEVSTTRGSGAPEHDPHVERPASNDGDPHRRSDG
jgi:TatA/E family protein of Tat protein translocase